MSKKYHSGRKFAILYTTSPTKRTNCIFKQAYLSISMFSLIHWKRIYMTYLVPMGSELCNQCICRRTWWRQAIRRYSVKYKFRRTFSPVRWVRVMSNYVPFARWRHSKWLRIFWKCRDTSELWNPLLSHGYQHRLTPFNWQDVVWFPGK